MKYIRLDLLTLLIGLFIFSSCNNPDQIGLEVDPADQIDVKLIDTATIKTVTVKEDTVQTSGLSQHPLGVMQDPLLGNTESRLAVSIGLPVNALSFGTAPVLDSAVLVLKYGDEFYGDSVSSHYTVNVQQLAEKYSPGQTYYNTKAWSASPTVIGTKTVTKFAIHDSVEVTQIMRGKADVKKRTAPHIRIPINSAFINTILNAPAASLASSTAFSNYIKGLYLTVKTQGAEPGGIVFFNLAEADSSRLEVYYRNISGTTIDTNMVKFNISNASAAANITHTYTTSVQAQLNNPAGNFGTVYAQPLAGLRVKVNFPYLNKLKELANVTVNKAELIVKVEGNTDNPLNPAPRLTLYRTDIAAQRQELSDASLFGSNGFGGFYDKNKKQYVFNVTSYIQDIINGRLTQYNTYIAPQKNSLVSSGSGDISTILPSATTAGRSILGGSSGTYKMKLNIIYTRLK